jgi:hypothetical protein
MRIYLQTNDAERNEIIAFERGENGMLRSLGRFPTGGRGSGKPHLASQSSVVVRDEPVAASTNLGAKGVRDEALSADGRFLYALDADARSVFGWRVGAGGELDPVGSFEGLPETVAGLAAG